MALIKSSKLKSLIQDPNQEVLQELLDAKMQQEVKRQELQGNIQEIELEIQSMKEFSEKKAKETILAAEKQAQEILDKSQIQINQQMEALQAQFNDLENQKQEFENNKSNFYKEIDAQKEAAFQQCVEEFKPVMDDFLNMLNEFRYAQNEMLGTVKDKIVALAVYIAKAIIGYEVATNDEFLQEQIQKAFHKVSASKGLVQVSLSPLDQNKVSELETHFKKAIDPDIKLNFIENEEVDQGFCIINTKGGYLDAKLSTQISSIEVAFEKYLGHKVGELDIAEEEPELEKEIIEQEIETEEAIAIQEEIPEVSELEETVEDKQPEIEVNADEFIAIQPNTGEPTEAELRMIEEDPELDQEIEIDDDFSNLLDEVMDTVNEEKGSEDKKMTATDKLKPSNQALVNAILNSDENLEDIDTGLDFDDEEEARDQVEFTGDREFADEAETKNFREADEDSTDSEESSDENEDTEFVEFDENKLEGGDDEYYEDDNFDSSESHDPRFPEY